MGMPRSTLFPTVSYTDYFPGMICSMCGNGVIEAGETCDDFDSSGGDGCSASCLVESSYNCETDYIGISACVVCGDGIF